MFPLLPLRSLRLAPVAAAAVAVFVLADPASGQNMELTPSAADPEVAFRSSATYDITFTAAWTTTVTAGGVPSGAHFSRLIGGVHNDQVVFLQDGQMASAGVESMAEIGGYSTLRSEVNAAGANRLRVLQGTTDFLVPTATATFSGVVLTTEHPRVTLVSMIAPSPDWFVGVSGLSMLDSSGEWKQSFTVNLYPWDAGTEEGTEFSLSNSATNPQGNITSIRNTGKFSDTAIATLTFTRQSVMTAAPRIDAVHTGDTGVTVVWTAPAGVTGITAYDLRSIPTSADETVNGNWTVREDVWTEGKLNAVIRTLSNGTPYDFQMRAITDVEGAWSATVAGTPVETGNTLATAIDLPLDLRLPADFRSRSDVDSFKFTLTEETGVLLFTTGDLDTTGTLFDSDGNLLAENDDGHVAGGPENFLIGTTLGAGTYHLGVDLYLLADDHTGGYEVHLILLPDTTGIGDATEVEVGGVRNGLIDPGGDEDYFSFTLGAETDLVLRGGPAVDNTVGELLNSSGVSLEENDDGYLLGAPQQFMIRRKLAAGAYFVKVKAFLESVTGLYSFHVEAVTEPGSDVASAQSLGFGEVGAGRIDPATDTDYFKIDLAGRKHILLRAVSNSVDIDGAVVDSGGVAVAADVFEQDFGSGGQKGFTVFARLNSGSHYLKVTRSGGDSTGGYSLRMLEDGVLEDEDMDDIVDLCAALSPPFGDALSGCQWHLRNRGQRGGRSGEDIRVEDVWSGGNMGDGIAVAVIDGGVHGDHPELIQNFNAMLSHDYTDGETGQIAPYTGGLWSHGTSSAGVIAARDNARGGRGVAPRATIYSYNLLLVEIDQHEVDAMSRNMATTGVSSNSWGADDGPGLDVASSAWEMAIDTGVTSGYGGKGVVYVWAAGNGDIFDDQANFDGRANYYGVVAACAVTDKGDRAEYSERGENLWVCAPSSGRGAHAGIFTTSNYGRYTNSFGGTSAATPIVSGVVALVRAANPALTWRDVKLILAGSARKNDSSNSGWLAGAQRYGASGSYNFNREYGFGVVDAKAAVDLAAGWDNLPPFMETFPVEATPNLSIPDSPGATVTSTVVAGPEVEFIEFVEVVTDFDAPVFSDLRVELVSPSNTVSTLAGQSGRGYGIDPDYRFGSARHLGENPAGTWTLRITDRFAADTATLKSWSLKIYGHRSRPTPPAISLVDRGQRSLTVSWSAPALAGASAITSYDVRTIRSDAPDKADKNRWAEVDPAWTAGALSYTVTGLLDLTGYDVQVRAVNEAGGGGWSATVMQETLPNRAPSAVGSLTGPDLQVGDGNGVVDAAAAFEDPEDDTLTYAASSLSPGVAGASVSGSRVTLTPVARGNATITVTATDIAGSNTPATQTFNVRVKARRGVTLSADALTVNEGSAATYTMVLDSEPTGTVTVTPSAPAGRNLSVDPPALEFTTGNWQVAQSVSVAAATDTNTASEPPVTISHQASGADYGSVGAPSVRVTIVERDTSVLSVDAAEASESAGTLTFEVTLSKASASEITVVYATSDGSGSAGARMGSDYTLASGTLTFPTGLTASQQIVVDILDDGEDEEEEETFQLTLRNAQHASLAGGGSMLQVLGKIADDDDPEVQVSFGSASYGVTEGRTVDVAVRLDRDPERDLEIFLEQTHHGGAADADYSGVPQSVSFGPGVRRQEFQVAATDDTVDDDGESVVVSFASLPSRVAGDGETTIAINDNDGSPSSPVGGGGGGGGGPPPGDDEEDDEEDDAGGGGGSGPPPPSGPPRADFSLTAECADGLCRARTGLAVTFEDTSTGGVVSRRWDFGDGTASRNQRIAHAWSLPGFYEVTLTVSDGTTTSIASRVVLVAASNPAGICETDAETLCLQDSRYAVGVDWWTAGGASGAASVVRSGTNDSGLFWFFDRENWEILIKVLDGCAVNGHVWVFGASTTDLGYAIRVTDTVTGAVKEYRNEPGLPASAITDGTAFPESCRR